MTTSQTFAGKTLREVIEDIDRRRAEMLVASSYRPDAGTIVLGVCLGLLVAFASGASGYAVMTALMHLGGACK